MTHKNALPYRLMAPGPVPIPERVSQVLAQPALHHRTPEFEVLLQNCFAGLKKVFATLEPVLMQTATGSGLMESALVNTLSPGDEVLCVVAGKFGERWAEMANRFGLNVHTLSLRWGAKLNLDEFEQSVRKYKNLKAVLTQACETSTATTFPIKEMSQITKMHTQALIMVDAITAMGCMELPMDAWDLDVIVAGSQKAFMLPTGIGFVGISKRAQEFHHTSRINKYYFDWTPELQLYPKTTRFSTPNSMTVALAEVLKMFASVGLETVQKRCHTLASTTRLGCEGLGLQLFSEAPSSSVTAIALPASVAGEKLRDWLEAEKNITVMGGQDQLKNKILRVGHMGAVTNEDVIEFFRALAEGLRLPFPTALESQLLNSLARSPEYFR